MKRLPFYFAAITTSLLLAGPAQAASYAFRIHVPGIQAPASQTGPAITYATLNPNDKGTTVALSDGNLTDVSSVGSGVRGTLGKSSGKWYYEMTIQALAGGEAPLAGVAGSSNTLQMGWYGTTDYLYWPSLNGELIYGNGNRLAYGANATTGDVIGVAVDLDNRQITFYQNGVSLGVGYSSAKLPAGTYFPFVSDPENGSSSTTLTVNFGQNPFRYSVPVGFNAGWYQ
jgi:hypothetical protein